MSITQKKIWSDPTRRKLLSEKIRKSWSDPDLVQRQKDILNKAYENPEVRERLSKSQKQRWSDPKLRKIASEKAVIAHRNPETRRTRRETFEKHEFWVPIEDHKPLTVYKLSINWNHRIMKTVELPNDLKIVGLYNVHSNPNGYVRDHKFSVFHAYKNKVFPRIVRHPCNCEIMLYTENSAKRAKSSITLERLFADIRAFSSNWQEQEECLRDIERYENGERYSVAEHIGSVSAQ